MLRALTTAATGMMAQQMNIDVISNNIANVNTNGFKKSKVEFQNLLSQTLKAPGAQISQGTFQPIGTQIGLGTKASGTAQSFDTGIFKQTGGKLDLAVEGNGFFQVQLDDGTYAYTRDGGFKMDATGQLTTTDGFIIQPQITIPEDATEINITPDGRVSVKTPGNANHTEVGTLELAKFVNPAGLISIGKNLYTETSASGNAQQGVPGQDGFGSIQQGFVEGSNVQTVEELINLIEAERAFESNSKIITTANNMLQTTNQIVR